MINIHRIWALIAILLVFTLISPHSLCENAHYSFHQFKKLSVDAHSLTFNLRDNLIYACSSRDIYVIDSTTDSIEKKINVIGSDYPPIYYISGIGFNSQTGKIYISVYPDEVLVMNADNYHIVKKIKISSTNNPNYGASAVYVNEKTNMIYVRSSLIPKYTVINGKNDTMVGLIPSGALDFEHDALWTWGRDPGYEYYNLTVWNLQNMKVVKRIVTPISFNNNFWENAALHHFGSKIYVMNMGYPAKRALIYSTDNYRYLATWSDLRINDMSAFDSNKNVIYGTYHESVNLTSWSLGISAIDANSGKIIGKEGNLTWSDGYHHLGEVSILGVNPETHRIYVSINYGNNSTALISYYLSYSHSVKSSYIQGTIIGVALVIIIIGLCIYWRYRKHNKRNAWHSEGSGSVDIKRLG